MQRGPECVTLHQKSHTQTGYKKAKSVCLLGRKWKVAWKAGLFCILAKDFECQNIYLPLFCLICKVFLSLGMR